MKTSKFIRKASQRLWDGKPGTYEKTCYVRKEEYICYALAAEGKKRGLQQQANRVCKLIDSRLGKGSSLRRWVAVRLGVEQHELPTEAMQRHRLQWMQMLADEYEAKGD
jgi:hypothetical protein